MSPRTEDGDGTAVPPGEATAGRCSSLAVGIVGDAGATDACTDGSCCDCCGCDVAPAAGAEGAAGEGLEVLEEVVF